ncbi:MAG: acetyltransferase [Devosia sp.]|nr:acetyltransferase [Devosia sp.]
MVEIIRGSEADDAVLARHYLALWESYGTPSDHYFSDAVERVIAFTSDARAQRELGVFLAKNGNDVVGSVACSTYQSPHPDVITPRFRKLGDIWSVFVEPRARQRGVRRALVDRATEHLRSIGCTTAVLHSSDAGERVYAGAGFKLAKEMRLDLHGEGTV